MTKIFFWLFSFLCLGIFTAQIAIGQAPTPLQLTPDPSQVSPDFLAYLVASFNGLKGASVIGSAYILVQVILKALSQPWSSYFFPRRSGISKLAIVAGLTFAITPIGLVSGAGLTIGAALVHSSTLTALMVFLNQLYQQTQKAKDDAEQTS